jgi:nitrogen fixation NifU-like protein
VSGAGAAGTALLQEAILRHYRAPHNRRGVPDATARAERRNPLCGDAIEVAVRLDGDRIADAAFDGRGCSIAVASASMLTDAVTGLRPDEALALAERVRRVLAGEAPASALPGELAALGAVVPYPARHGCAAMAWGALREALGDNRRSG